MNISAIVRSDNGGLGTLSSLFARGLGFHRTISLSRIAGEHHPERFVGKDEGGGMKDEPVNRHAGAGPITPELVEWVCRGADVLVSFETWYGDTVPAMARALGVKTALMPMVECCPREGFGLSDTDLAICCNAMCLEAMRDDTPDLSRAVKIMLPPPCDVERIWFHPRERARVFVHHVGHAGSSDRNNTSNVIAAWQYVESPAKLVLRSQGELPPLPADPRISVVRGAPADYWDLWNGDQPVGDVYLHPHRWEGCGLPMYESLAAGMPVMTTRWWPFCDEGERKGWLPPSSQGMAIDVTERRETTILRRITSHETTPRAIAAAVDRTYGMDLAEASMQSRKWAEAHSWSVMREHWVHLFRWLVDYEKTNHENTKYESAK